MSRFRTDLAARECVPTQGRRRSFDRARGASLIAIVPMLLLLSVAAMSLLAQGQSNLVRVELNERSVRALEMCEIGVARSLHEVAREEDVDGEDGVGGVQDELATGEFDAEAIRVDRRHYRIRSLGRATDAARTIEVLFRATPTTVFSRALAGVDDVLVGGGFLTDSYDSEDGPYLAQLSNADEHGSYAHAFGGVACNGTLAIEGGSTGVRGGANAGPGETVTIGGSPTITGSTDSLSAPLDLPAPPYEEFVDAHANNQNGTWLPTLGVNYDPVTYTLSLGGGANLVLPPGTYFFTSVTLGGRSSITVQGPTRIYLVGNLDGAGGTITNVTERARDLSIIAHPYQVPVGHTPPDPMTVNIAGSASTALTVYAPGCDVTLAGGSDLFGAVVGRTIDARGASFHYDESLGYEDNLEFQPYSRVGWREIGRPVD